jgi:hypothetical protein
MQREGARLEWLQNPDIYNSEFVSEYNLACGIE